VRLAHPFGVELLSVSSHCDMQTCAALLKSYYSGLHDGRVSAWRSGPIQIEYGCYKISTQRCEGTLCMRRGSRMYSLNGIHLLR